MPGRQLNLGQATLNPAWQDFENTRDRVFRPVSRRRLSANWSRLQYWVTRVSEKGKKTNATRTSRPRCSSLFGRIAAPSKLAAVERGGFLLVVKGHEGWLKRGVTGARFNTKHCCETNCYKLVFFHIIGLQRGPCGASPWAAGGEWGRGQREQRHSGKSAASPRGVRLQVQT